jgi:1-deoxy-D-xylulose-5-phosphate synthase
MAEQLLPSIKGPRDLDRLSQAELEQLAEEVRAFLIEHVSRTGGHLGPNLGVVELTLAIHRVFDSPKDAVVFDTGHQSYVHKLLTGRQNFDDLRERGGLAGYPQRAESEHDIVESSHASSSLSWADGISRAWQVTGQGDRAVVAVVGDGALTGGMTWEALNNISDDNSRRLVIVVNDNGRSYAPTIGGMARFLNRVRTDRTYTSLQKSSDRAFSRFGGKFGRSVYRAVRGGLHGFLSRFTNNDSLYSNLDIKYLGPIDGHDERAVEEALRQARDYGQPVIVHVITEKGHGFKPATDDINDHGRAGGRVKRAVVDRGVRRRTGQGRRRTRRRRGHHRGNAAPGRARAAGEEVPETRTRRRYCRAARGHLGGRNGVRRPAPGRRDLRDIHEPGI